MRWHYPPGTRFEIRSLAVWGRACYLSVTEAPHNIEYLRVSGEETLCSFETLRPEWGSSPRSPTFQAGNLNHCTRAPVLCKIELVCVLTARSHTNFTSISGQLIMFEPCVPNIFCLDLDVFILLCLCVISLSVFIQSTSNLITVILWPKIVAMTFLRIPSCYSRFIQNFLDH